MIAMTQKVLFLFHFLQRFLPLQALQEVNSISSLFPFGERAGVFFLFVSTDEVAPGLSEVNDDDDDDAGWYRREVGKEPDPGKYQHNNNNCRGTWRKALSDF